ncbi:MAG: substrate-binding domain-containing protein [Treponema sp.]|nr:substrate-binding domain-containing protein [Treponema sp.]
MKKNTRITNIVLSIVILSLLIPLLSCKKKVTQESTVVGVLIKNDQEEFWKTYKKNIIDSAQQTGVPINIYAFDNDVPTQIDQIKTLLMNGTKYFFIVPANTAVTEQITKIINSQGGVAVFSNVVPSADALKVGENFYFTTSPETDAGAYQAELLDEYFKKNPSKLTGKTVNVLYFNGEFGHPAQIPRREGFLQAMKQKGYTVNILAQVAANWNSKSAKESMNLWLAKYGTEGLDAVITQNDDMAIGAIQAFIENGFTDDPTNQSKDTDGDGIVLPVPIIGVDGTDEGRKMINQKLLYGSVFQDMKTQISSAFEIIKECHNHGTAIGFTTSLGVKAAEKTSTEPPLTDASILKQCFVVPYVPVKK